MKVNLILAAVAAALGSPALYAAGSTGSNDSSAPKNLARQHLGANLLIFNAADQTYAPTEAAAAWLDDDVATGWPALTGKQDYLVALPEAALINNFCISAKSASGTVTLYAGDESAPPGAKSWTLLAKDVPVDFINEKLGKPFGRFAKYLLIESNLTESGPWYSVYVYGENAATGYHISQRAQPVDPRTVFGPYTNPQTSISLSSLYAHSRIVAAGGEQTAWLSAIDDNPSSGAFIPATQSDAGLAIQYDRSYAVNRISVLAAPGTKGKLEFFVVNAPASTAPTAASQDKSGYVKVANVVGASAAAGTDLSKQTPVTSVNFDGTNPRASVDFTPVQGTVLLARWTPDTAGQPLNVREVNSFGDVALNDYELTPAPISEGPATADNQATGGSGKDLDPAGDGKTELPPAVGEQEPPPKLPFVPGVPPFPPHVPVSP